MKLLDYLQAEHGRGVRVAAELGVAPAYLRQMAAGARPCPAERAVDLERATGGAVRRWDVHPDDWHRIWPELIGAEGAPSMEGETVSAAGAPTIMQFGGRRASDHPDSNFGSLEETVRAVSKLTGDRPGSAGKGERDAG